MRKAIILAVVTLSLGLSATASAEDDVGKLKFKKNCVTCHGVDGKGKTEMGLELKSTDLSTAAVQDRLTDKKIEEQILNGNEEKKMPAFKEKLSAEEVTAVVKHVRTLRAK